MINDTTVTKEPKPGSDVVCSAKTGYTGKLLQKRQEERRLLLAGITGGCGGKNGQASAQEASRLATYGCGGTKGETRRCVTSDSVNNIERS